MNGHKYWFHCDNRFYFVSKSLNVINSLYLRVLNITRSLVIAIIFMSLPKKSPMIVVGWA